MLFSIYNGIDIYNVPKKQLAFILANESQPGYTDKRYQTLMLRFPVSLKKISMEMMLVTVRTVEYAAALPKQSRMTSV